MPGRVDVGRRAHGPARDLGQHEEAGVLLGHGQRVAQRPSLVVGQARLKGQRVVGVGEINRLDSRQQRGGGGGELGVQRGGDGSLPFLLLWTLLVVVRSVVRRADCRQLWETAGRVKVELRAPRRRAAGRGGLEK